MMNTFNWSWTFTLLLLLLANAPDAASGAPIPVGVGEDLPYDNSAKVYARSKGKDDDDSEVGAIVGGVLGGLFLLGAIIAIILIVRPRLLHRIRGGNRGLEAGVGEEKRHHHRQPSSPSAGRQWYNSRFSRFRSNDDRSHIRNEKGGMTSAPATRSSFLKPPVTPRSAHVIANLQLNNSQSGGGDATAPSQPVLVSLPAAPPAAAHHRSRSSSDVSVTDSLRSERRKVQVAPSSAHPISDNANWLKHDPSKKALWGRSLMRPFRSSDKAKKHPHPLPPVPSAATHIAARSPALAEFAPKRPSFESTYESIRGMQKKEWDRRSLDEYRPTTEPRI